MSKKLLAIFMCVAILSTVSSAFAEDVYITESGKKYHSQDCRLIANRNARAISLQDAETKNLVPCSKCIGKEQISKQTNPTESEDAETVYITSSGKKYHKQDCRWVKNRDAKAMSLADAQAEGLKPCGRCFPEEVAKK